MDDFANHFFDGIKIGFRLKRVRNPVELAAGQRRIVVGRIVLVVLQSKSILPTVIAPVIVRKRRHCLSRTMARRASAPLATCDATPP